MECTSQQTDDLVTIQVKGRMDALTASNFEQAFAPWMDQNIRRFVVDFSALEYISSAGLRVILSIGKQLKARRSVLIFGGMQGIVAEVFQISGFTSIFAVYDSVEAALAAN